MIDQEFCVHTEETVQKVLIGFGNILHGTDAEGIESSGDTGAHPPEIRERFVIPQSLPVTFFCEFPDKVRSMFGGDIQGNLSQIEISTDTTGGADADLFINVLHDTKPQVSGRKLVEGKVVGYIHKGFINGVDMNIFFGNIF